MAKLKIRAAEGPRTNNQTRQALEKKRCTHIRLRQSVQCTLAQHRQRAGLGETHGCDLVRWQGGSLWFVCAGMTAVVLFAPRISTEAFADLTSEVVEQIEM